MNAHDRLRQAIDLAEARLRADVPLDRQEATLALVRALDRQSFTATSEPPPDLVTGRRLANLGGNRALQLCLEAAGNDAPGLSLSAGDGLEVWAERFLDQCGRLIEAELVLAHHDSGFIRLIEEGDGTFAAWIATKRAPTSWRERADIDWWAAWLAKHHEPELLALRSKLPGRESSEPGDDTTYRRLADVRLTMMGYQLAYPADALIGGCTVQTYRDVLAVLIGWALRARDHGAAAAAHSEHSLVAELAATLAADPAVISQALAGFTSTARARHITRPCPAPRRRRCVRVGPDRIVASVQGLTTEPLLFLTRELRRRDAEAYHNTAHLREAVFRQDLYALFQDKRFVTSAGRIALRRDDGDVRTDIDAAVFDRKTGTLGLFELKSQDPFARSTAELARQRDNVPYANRQISGVLTWLQRHGGDALLGRIDPRVAKTFRVQKVYPFVLGRYLVHFNDGPNPDRRAAWGTWPQVLRLRDGQPFRASDSNPLASLYTRLTTDVPLIQPPTDGSPREIALGPTRLAVYPSYAAFQASADQVQSGTGR